VTAATPVPAAVVGTYWFVGVGSFRAGVNWNEAQR
jgi:hypothetical protein